MRLKPWPVMLAIVFATTVLLASGSTKLSESLAVSPTTPATTVGSVHFVEIYFLAGKNLERRSPRVGEEFLVKAKIRNEGPAAIYYLPSLCDTSLSAVFDPSYVRVESGRPRCLAASMPTPLKPGEETTVSAPESGMAYMAIRAGSTTATAIFTYNAEAIMDPSTQNETRSTVPLTIQDEAGGFHIPGFPIESLIVGFALALGILLYLTRSRLDRKSAAHGLNRDL